MKDIYDYPYKYPPSVKRMLFSSENFEPIPVEIVLLCAALVILMQLGFACLESGLVDARNTLSVLYKNTLDFCFGLLAFTLVWTLLFGAKTTTPSEIADVLYSATFATTAATICSGALAGRIRLSAYVFLSIFITGAIYPIGAKLLFVEFSPTIGNTLSDGKFYDLAGAVAVHSVGGFSALAAALYIGRRKIVRQSDRVQFLEKEEGDSKTIEQTEHFLSIRPHSIPLASIGMFLLLVGWFGFNIGSSETIDNTAIIALNTVLAAAAGGSAAFLVGKMTHTPALSLTINGVLGGLVSITSCANIIESWEAVLLGVFAGTVVVLWLNFVQRSALFQRYLEDPIGAFPVHGLCGVIGGLAVAVLGNEQETVAWLNNAQVTMFETPWQIGLTIFVPLAAAVSVLVFLSTYDFLATRLPNRIVQQVRVSAAEQGVGLDLVDYAEQAYDFGERLDKPEDLLEHLEILTRRFSSDKIVFQNCATDKSDNPKQSTQPFKARFTYWLSDINQLAHRYSDAFGEYSAGVHGSALDIAERIEDASRRLAQYVEEPTRIKKEEIFEQRGVELKNAVETLHNILLLHVQQRSGGQQVVESMAHQLEELKTELALLSDKYKALRSDG